MRHLLAFGNSLTAGFSLPEDSSFAAQLQNRLQSLGYAVQVENAGISGDTTMGGLSRIDHYLTNDYDLILLELGANDILMGFPLEMIQENLDALIRKCTAHAGAVLLDGVEPPVVGGNEYLEQVRAMFASLAERHQIAMCPDLMQGVPDNPGLTLFDQFHPNQAGVGVMVENILPVLLCLLK